MLDRPVAVGCTVKISALSLFADSKLKKSS